MRTKFSKFIYDVSKKRTRKKIFQYFPIFCMFCLTPVLYQHFRVRVRISLKKWQIQTQRLIEETNVIHEGLANDIDFTFGTILAGRNTDTAYRNIEQLKIREIRSKNTNIDLNGVRVGMFTDELGGIPPSGGIGYCVAELATLLAKHGAELTLLYLGDNGNTNKTKESLSKKGIKFLKLPAPETKIASPPGTLTKSFQALLHLMNVDEQNPYDIIHFNDYLGHALFPLYAKRQGWLLAKSRVVVTLHGISSWARFGNKALPKNHFDMSIDYYENESIAEADTIVAPSRFIARFVKSRGVNMKDVVFLPNAPPTLPASMTNRNILAANQEAVQLTEIVFFGRLEYRKGPWLLSSALEMILEEAPNAMVSITVGRIILNTNFTS